MKDLRRYIKEHQENKEKSSGFVDYLYELMDKYGYDKNSDLYNKAGISRQYWSLLISGKNVPSLITAVRLVFALQADNHECKYLLKKAGYTLSSSSTYALILRYCLENGIYDRGDVNKLLNENGIEESLWL